MNFNFGGVNSIYGNHIYFIRDPDNQSSTFSFSFGGFNSSAKNLFLLDPPFRFNILNHLPRLFKLTTNNGSAQFNTEILKDTSSVINDFLKDNPEVFQYHLDIEDKENVLGKFEQLYQGNKVVFDEDELPISKKITKILNIKCCPNYMKPESLKSDELTPDRGLGLAAGVGVSKNYLSQFIRQEKFRNFIIVSDGKEFKCNVFGVCASQVIRELIQKDPKLKRYEYDINDEYSDFQPFINLLNFDTISITASNMYILKDAAEQLKIDFILPKIDKNIAEFEKVSKTIDEQQAALELIENLFKLLYNVNNNNIESVKNEIVESNWTKTEEDVQELAAFIIQVVKSSFVQHPYLIDLLIKLDQEANEHNKLNILKPFINKQFMLILGESLPVCSFVYNLYRQGFIEKKYLYDELKSYYEIQINPAKNKGIAYLDNIFLWFLPEFIEMNIFNNIFFSNEIATASPMSQMQTFGFATPKCSFDASKFIKSYYPSKIDLYKKMRDSGQPDDELTVSLRIDDVDKVQSILSSSGADFSQVTIPFNIFEIFVPNGQTRLINYAASYGSIKCFKYLLLNHCELNDTSFSYAVFSGNTEIIKIIEQKTTDSSANLLKSPQMGGMNFNNQIPNNAFGGIPVKFNMLPTSGIVRNDIYPAIMKHQNNLFDWILEQRYTNNIEANSNRFLLNSVENGNAHSFIEVIDRCNNSCNFQELIQTASKFGFYSLANIIFDIMNKRSPEFINNFNFGTVQPMGGRGDDIGNGEIVIFNTSYVSFGSLSIFKLGLKINKNQDELEKQLSYCIDKGYNNIFDYYMDVLIKNDFQITRSFILRSVSKALSVKSSYCFNRLIDQIMQSKPLIFYGFEQFSKLLITACQSGNIEYVKAILSIMSKYKLTQNITNSFIEAALNNSLEICKYFIDEKINVNYPQITLRANDIGKCNKEVFSLIINNSSPEMKQTFIICSLIPAIRNKNKELIEFLFENNVPHDDALIEAVNTNNVDIVNLILKYDSKPSFVNKRSLNGTALFIAVSGMNNLEIVRCLLKVPGINPSLYERNDRTPLIASIINTNLDIMNAILDFYGDDIQSQAWQLNKAIEITFGLISTNQPVQNQPQPSFNNITIDQRKNQLPKILKRILEIKNIDPNNHGSEHTLLSYACETNDIDIVKMLLKTDKLDVNAYAPISGNTPLMIAILNKNAKIAQLLINDERTNINIRNYQDETALTMAARLNLDKIIDLIIKCKSFDPKESCLDYSFFISTGKIAKQLIALGSVDVNYKYTKGSTNYGAFVPFGTATATTVTAVPATAQGFTFNLNLVPNNNNNNNNNNNDDDDDDYDEEESDDENNNNNNNNNNNANNFGFRPAPLPVVPTPAPNSCVGYKYETPLSRAVQQGDLEKLDLIISSPTFDKVQSQLNRVIFESVGVVKIELFRKLLSLIDNDVNIVDDSNKSLLIQSLSSPQYVDEILKNDKFDSKKTDIKKAFIISYKKYNISMPILQMLYDYDSKHDQLIKFDEFLPNGKSYFTSIIQCDRIKELIDFFVEHGADPDKPDKNGFYPLEYAILTENREFVLSLLDLNRIDLTRKIPVKDESIIGLYQTFNQNLMQASTSTTTTTGFSFGTTTPSPQPIVPSKSKSKYKTYLHLAAKGRMIQTSSFNGPLNTNTILNIFLEKNLIDINIEDDQGETPLMDAARTKSFDNIRLLFQKENLDYKHCNKDGEDALKIIKSKTKPTNRNEYLLNLTGGSGTFSFSFNNQPVVQNNNNNQAANAFQTKTGNQFNFNTQTTTTTAFGTNANSQTLQAGNAFGTKNTGSSGSSNSSETKSEKESESQNKKDVKITAPSGKTSTSTDNSDRQNNQESKQANLFNFKPAANPNSQNNQESKPVSMFGNKSSPFAANLSSQNNQESKPANLFNFKHAADVNSQNNQESKPVSMFGNKSPFAANADGQNNQDSKKSTLFNFKSAANPSIQNNQESKPSFSFNSKSSPLSSNQDNQEDKPASLFASSSQSATDSSVRSTKHFESKPSSAFGLSNQFATKPASSSSSSPDSGSQNSSSFSVFGTKTSSLFGQSASPTKDVQPKQNLESTQLQQKQQNEETKQQQQKHKKEPISNNRSSSNSTSIEKASLNTATQNHENQSFDKEVESAVSEVFENATPSELKMITKSLSQITSNRVKKATKSVTKDDDDDDKSDFLFLDEQPGPIGSGYPIDYQSQMMIQQQSLQQWQQFMQMSYSSQLQFNMQMQQMQALGINPLYRNQPKKKAKKTKRTKK